MWTWPLEPGAPQLGEGSARLSGSLRSASSTRCRLGQTDTTCPPAPPPAGCEHLRNDHGVSVDFNTADPLIRWDSYENLSADGEGALGCLASVTCLCPKCPLSARNRLSLWRGGPPPGRLGCSWDQAWGVGAGAARGRAIVGGGQSVKLSPGSFPAQCHSCSLLGADSHLPSPPVKHGHQV